MAEKKKQTEKKPMTGREIRAELLRRGFTMKDISNQIPTLSYQTVAETILGYKKNPVVLKHLNDLGIDHGRVPGKMIVSYEDGSKKMVAFNKEEAA